MTKKDREEIEKGAVLIFGGAAQILKAVEEMSELTKELMKYSFESIQTKGFNSGIRKINKMRKEEIEEHIAEEMADVEIMLGQLKIIFNNRRKTAKWKKYKLERLDETIEDNIKIIKEGRKIQLMNNFIDGIKVEEMTDYYRYNKS